MSGGYRLRYRGYTIMFSPKPMPDRRHDFDYVHDEYDGPPDLRCGTAETIAAARREINEIEGERR